MVFKKIISKKEYQSFDDYQVQAYRNWEQLWEKQLKNIKFTAVQPFIEGLEKIENFIETIPTITNLSQFLQDKTGWQLYPVTGLLEPEDYFYLLSRRYFPVATFVRSNSDLNYSPLPDIWHDVFGHIPLLFSSTYSNFVQYLGHQYITRQDQKEAISRLYWYTIEAGVCYEEDKLRVYGASQLSSLQEIWYAVSDRPVRFPFDLDRVIHSPVRIDRLQSHLFEIPSFNYLAVIQHEFDLYLSNNNPSDL